MECRLTRQSLQSHHMMWGIYSFEVDEPEPLQFALGDSANRCLADNNGSFVVTIKQVYYESIASITLTSGSHMSSVSQTDIYVDGDFLDARRLLVSR